MISVSSRLVWSMQRAPGQPKLHSEALSQINIQKENKSQIHVIGENV